MKPRISTHSEWPTAVLTTLLLFGAVGSASTATFTSPDRQLEFTVSTASEGRLVFAITREGRTVILKSPLGVTVDGHDLGIGVVLGKPTRREIRERFACRGVKSEAINHCLAYELPVTHRPTGNPWTLEVRLFNDGAAYRYRVPGQGLRRLTGEASGWRLPSEAVVWLQNNTASYEGPYYRCEAARIPTRTDKGSLFVGCPVTVELPRGGYALLTESCLYDYSGMTLRPTSEAGLQAVFEDDPRGWEHEGPIVSPWRVTLVARDLNALVNSDVIASLGEAPDPILFPKGANTPWIRPGKGLITWAVFLNDGAQWRRQKWFVDMCAAMNCEYLLVDGGWRTEKWGFLKDGGDLWRRLEELCAYAAARNVGIFVWNAYPEGRDDGPGMTDPERRREFFRRCKEVGVKGVKIDFFNSESRKTVGVYEDILRETAENRLMVNFHGANKPTGETRTWPHEITREGIREQEYVLWDQLPLEHYGALPFTRMVAGHGDFLPGFVRPKFLRNTTAVFQLATAVLFTSPFICWPDHPEAYLESPFLSLVRTMPPVWDETRVLDGSKIGERVAFARRAGERWFVAVLNCRDEAVRHEVELSFLGDDEYRATLYHDGDDQRAEFRIEAGGVVRKSTRLSLTLQAGGGFVGEFSPPPVYTE